jgi:hypothetical protein
MRQKVMAKGLRVLCSRGLCIHLTAALFDALEVVQKMRSEAKTRSAWRLPAMSLIAGAALALSFAEKASAGIIAPQQIEFSADDLAKSLADRDSGGTSSSAAGRERSQRLPLTGYEQPVDPLSLQESHSPFGSNSSSSSSSSSGANVSTGSLLCVLGRALSLRDDSPLGNLPDDHGLSLPDHPGTDLLRPPRA